jgi:hypothetical protein
LYSSTTLFLVDDLLAHKKTSVQTKTPSLFENSDNVTMSYISTASFNLWAIKLFTNQEISWALDPPSQLSLHRFRSLFLLTPKECEVLWTNVYNRERLNGGMPFNRPEHLLWTLYYLKVYPTWDQMATLTGASEKTLHKWITFVVEYLAGIKDWVREYIQYKSFVQRLCVTK